MLALLAMLALQADPAVVEARAHFEEGRRAYDAGHFVEARAWFERAWDKKQVPELLFNIGQCDLQTHDYDSAIENYQRYLALEPAAENRLLVEDLILEARIALRAQPPPPTPIEAAQAALASVVRGDGTTGEDAPARSQPNHDNRWLWAGAIAGTIAVVAVGGAVAAFAFAPPTPSLGVIDGRH